MPVHQGYLPQKMIRNKQNGAWRHTPKNRQGLDDWKTQRPCADQWDHDLERVYEDDINSDERISDYAVPAPTKRRRVEPTKTPDEDPVAYADMKKARARRRLEEIKALGTQALHYLDLGPANHVDLQGSHDPSALLLADKRLRRRFMIRRRQALDMVHMHPEEKMPMSWSACRCFLHTTIEKVMADFHACVSPAVRAMLGKQVIGLADLLSLPTLTDGNLKLRGIYIDALSSGGAYTSSARGPDGLWGRLYQYHLMKKAWVERGFVWDDAKKSVHLSAALQSGVVINLQALALFPPGSSFTSGDIVWWEGMMMDLIRTFDASSTNCNGWRTDVSVKAAQRVISDDPSLLPFNHFRGHGRPDDPNIATSWKASAFTYTPDGKHIWLCKWCYGSFNYGRGRHECNDKRTGCHKGCKRPTFDRRVNQPATKATRARLHGTGAMTCIYGRTMYAGAPPSDAPDGSQPAEKLDGTPEDIWTCGICASTWKHPRQRHGVSLNFSNWKKSRVGFCVNHLNDGHCICSSPGHDIDADRGYPEFPKVRKLCLGCHSALRGVENHLKLDLNSDADIKTGLDEVLARQGHPDVVRQHFPDADDCTCDDSGPAIATPYPRLDLPDDYRSCGSCALAWNKKLASWQPSKRPNAWVRMVAWMKQRGMSDVED
ncbi:hypothetical protein KVT40_002564 [Elsinoe batatas]|uniref:Uncharacterized protein n=1 Tax=Elsinoe batatas TaxID=2601811 RepID=A0A8K0L2W6_9PEZI|nr:hypothetical protein KVT40_002564 [Elsinoe batatas]